MWKRWQPALTTTLRPELYDVITKTKNVRDEESAEMVDLIIKNRVFDPYYINLITGYTFMQEALQQKSEEIVSRLESYRTAAENGDGKDCRDLYRKSSGLINWGAE